MASVLLDGDLVDRQGDGLRPGRTGHVGGQPHGAGLVEGLVVVDDLDPPLGGLGVPGPEILYDSVPTSYRQHNGMEIPDRAFHGLSAAVVPQFPSTVVLLFKVR